MTSKEHQIGSFRLDPVNQCLWAGGEQISLSPKAFAVLIYLAERPGRLVTKQELLDAVWSDIHVTEGVLKRAILEIRKALSDPADEPHFIQTLHRRGYRLITDAGEPQPVPRLNPELRGVVGRAREVRQLDAWFGDAMGSSRQVVFITGEAGLGKTTLVDHWIWTLHSQRQPSDRSVVVARGRCLQQFGSGEPYLPVFEALEQLAQALGRRLVDVLRSRAPTWLLHMPALISLEDRARLRDEVFGSTRERMLREITDALEALSGETPVVLALEDLHWSDPSTIDLLSSIARRTSPARLMILGTYRPADAGGGPLLGAQNELELHRQCKVLPLSFLSEHATGEYVSARLDALEYPVEHSSTLAAALHERTNGNPLYIVCLVDELARSGAIEANPNIIRELVPGTLQQMFERHAAQLEQADQDMLDAAATAGELFSVSALAAALGWEGTQVEARCEALVRRHVILKRGGQIRFPDGSESSGYSFLHALCRDALYRRIPSGRRARLHGLLGQADEQLYASDPKRIAAGLAGHFELAADFSRAVHYLRMAAEVAAGRYSVQEAAQYLDRAFVMLERVRGDDQASCRMDLLEQRAIMRLIASEMPGAVADFRAIADQAALLGAVDSRIGALLEPAPPLLFVDYRQAFAAIDEAKAAQSGSKDASLAAAIDTYQALFNLFLYGWRQDLANQLRSAAPKLNSLTDTRMRGRLAWMEAAELTFCARYSAACEKAELARQFCRKSGVFYDYFIATLFLNWSLLHKGNLGQAMRIAKEGASLAERNGSLFPLQWLTMRQVWAEMEAFSFERALTVAERIAEDPRITSHRANAPAFLWVGLARLGGKNYNGAWDAFERLRIALEEGGVAHQCRFPLLNGRAECAVERGDTAGARTIAQDLVREAREECEFSYEARGLRLLAELASRADDFHSALRHLKAALAVLAEGDAWTVEWRVHAAAAQVYSRLGQFEESDQSRDRALQVAQRVADSLIDEPALQQSFMTRVRRDSGAASFVKMGR